MATWRQLTYMVLDELKLTSDDAEFNEEHIVFLLDKYRAFLFKYKYKTLYDILESNFQTLCLDLEQVPSFKGDACSTVYLRSTKKVPTLLSLCSPRIYVDDYFQGEIALVSKNRFKYTGYNKWLSNMIYATIGPDKYLYLKSTNPQFLYLTKIKITGLFENAKDAAELSCCNDDSTCDYMDSDFPLEDALVTTLIELVVKEIGSKIYIPADKINDADDSLAGLSLARSNNNSEKSE